MGEFLPIRWCQLASQLLEIWVSGQAFDLNAAWYFPDDWGDDDRARFLSEFYAAGFTALTNEAVVRFVGRTVGEVVDQWDATIESRALGKLRLAMG